MGSLGGLGLVVHLGASALLGFEFLLFLEFAFGFFDAHAGVHFEEVSEVVRQASAKYHVGIVCLLACVPEGAEGVILGYNGILTQRWARDCCCGRIAHRVDYFLIVFVIFSDRAVS